MYNPSASALVVGTAIAHIASVSLAQDDADAHHDIDEVIVTASPLKRTVEQLAQPTAVLRGAELAQKQSTSIGETVSQEVGVSSTYFGPVSSRPVIRGQYGERVRVLSNGLDSLDASALSEDHQATVEGLLANRIEIVRGPATLLYGSGAAGGLVNVVDSRIIESPLEQPFSLGMAIGADTATGKRDIAARTQFGSGSLAFNLDYFLRRTDDIEIPGFAESQILRDMEEEEGEEEEEAFGIIENSDSETDGGAAGLSFTGDRGFIGVSASTFNSNYGVPGDGHAEEELPLPIEEEETVRIDLEQTRVDLKGEYDFDGSVLAGLRFRAALNDYTHTEFEGDEIGTVFDTKGADARLELRHAQWGPLEGAIGAQFKSIDFDAIGDEAFVPGSETQRVSIFLFEELSIGESWVLQVSGRAERQTIRGADIALEYDDDAFGASIGTVWRPLPDLRFSANLAFTERHPNATELYADGPHIAVQRYERGSVTLGDGILGKEKSTNLDLTVHGDSGRIEWSLTGFVNSVDDFILLRPTSEIADELQVFDYRQTDVEFFGLEAEALFEVQDSDNSHLHIRLFADLVKAEEQVSGANLPRIPPARLGVGLHWGWQKLDGSLDAIFADSQTDVAENELPTDGYTLLNASVSYTFDDPGLYLFLRATNLLDEDIRQHTSPLKDLVPLPARSLQAGLRYEF